MCRSRSCCMHLEFWFIKNFYATIFFMDVKLVHWPDLFLKLLSGSWYIFLFNLASMWMAYPLLVFITLKEVNSPRYMIHAVIWPWYWYWCLVLAATKETPKDLIVVMYFFILFFHIKTDNFYNIWNVTYVRRT